MQTPFMVVNLAPLDRWVAAGIRVLREYQLRHLFTNITKFCITPLLFHAKTNVLNILKIKLIQPKTGAGSNRVPIQQAILVPRFQPNQIILSTARIP